MTRPEEQTPTLVRVYTDHEQARAAIEALKADGVEPSDISVVAGSTAEVRALDRETGAGWDLEREVQAHPLRDVLDWLGRIEAVVVPGFSSVLATGDLGLHLSRATPARGAITAALVERGVPLDAAEHAEQEVLNGRILVLVRGDRGTPETA